jgi:Tol biopolymer transport system component
MSRIASRLCLVLGLLSLLTLPAASVHAKEMMGASSPTWSPDGRQIAFTIRTQYHIAIYVVGANAATAVKIADDADGPDWSPDGAWIAYVDFARSSGAITIIRPDGSQRTKIANGHMPLWSPDGRQIAYIADDLLYVTTVDGSGSRRLLGDSVLHAWSISWSPDGSRIAVAMARAGAEWARVYVVKPDGSDVRALVDGVGSQISWSPDSRRFLFSGECGPRGEAGVCISDIDATTSSLMFPGGEAPRWSPDGARIAFVLNSGICMIDADGSNQRCLTAPNSNDWLAPSAWSPDGKQIFVQRAHNPQPNGGEPYVFYFEVLVFHADGSGFYRLPDGIETL